MNKIKKVWILENENSDHNTEIEIYKKTSIDWKLTSSTNYQEDLETFGKEADAVVAQVSYPCDADLINQLSNCKAIFSFGVGYNNIDLKAAREKEIDVCHLPDYCLNEVADHTVTLALSSIRRIEHYDRETKEGKWDPVPEKPIFRMENTTIGLYGFGNIARKVAKRLKVFGTRVIAHDDYVSKSVFNEHGVEKVTFDDLLINSNVLSLHVPLTPETKNSLNYNNLKKLPPHAILINTSRGEVINENDLLLLIKEGHISGAGLDVLKQVPPQKNNKLIKEKNVIVTPHSAYYSEESEKELQTRTANNVIRAISGEKPYHIVN